VLYIRAAQQLGAVRSQAIFASAPFIGAALSYGLLGDPLAPSAMIAAALMVGSACLLFDGTHAHPHRHPWSYTPTAIAMTTHTTITTIRTCRTARATRMSIDTMKGCTPIRTGQTCTIDTVTSGDRRSRHASTTQIPARCHPQRARRAIRVRLHREVGAPPPRACSRCAVW
jgi:hypothetical protein